jgi:hypothetical protein
VWRRRYVHRYVCRNPVLTRFEFLDVKCVIENAGRPGLRCLFAMRTLYGLLPHFSAWNEIRLSLIF